MAGELARVDVRLLAMAPELAAAIVAAQKAAGPVKRDGESAQRDESGNKIRYSSADGIGAAASAALHEHGAAWVRLDTALHPPTLEKFDLGKQAYVGDLHTQWMIVHEGGAAIIGGSEMPIIVSRGRPHDKAAAASTTYDSGGVLRGALCLEREGKHSIDGRGDSDDGASKPPDIGPRCTGPKGAPIAAANKRRVEALAAVDENAGPGDVWDWAVRESGIVLSKYMYPMPTSDELTIADGLVVRAILKTACGRNGVDDAAAEDTP